MCAIVGSFDTNTLLNLVDLNSYRGSHSYSFSLVDTYTNVLNIQSRGLGEIDKKIINVPERHYGIVHIQAPTTDERSLDSIHPARADFISSYRVDKNTVHEQYNICLWHNGIMKDETVKELQKSSGNIKWDTMLMLCELMSHGWAALDKFDGTFSCLFYANRGMYLFRNEISPMFIDSDLNISSTRFSGSKETEPNKVLKMEFDHKSAAPIHSFKTVENPYYFGE